MAAHILVAHDADIVRRLPEATVALRHEDTALLLQLDLLAVQRVVHPQEVLGGLQHVVLQHLRGEAPRPARSRCTRKAARHRDDPLALLPSNAHPAFFSVRVRAAGDAGAAAATAAQETRGRQHDALRRARAGPACTPSGPAARVARVWRVALGIRASSRAFCDPTRGRQLPASARRAAARRRLRLGGAPCRSRCRAGWAPPRPWPPPPAPGHVVGQALEMAPPGARGTPREGGGG